MEKAFVNKKIKRVEGTAILEAEKAVITKQITEETGTKPTASVVETAVLQKTILLADDSGGVLLGICSDPKIKKTQNSIIITILDDIVPVATINKNTLIDACAAKMQPDVLEGVTYLVPLLDHAVMLEYRFYNRIDVQGDISGLSFYFKK